MSNGSSGMLPLTRHLGKDGSLNTYICLLLLLPSPHSVGSRVAVVVLKLKSRRTKEWKRTFGDLAIRWTQENLTEVV